MIYLSTHTLDSSNGTHASGIKVKLFALHNDNKLIEIWSRATDKDGRLIVEFELADTYKDCELQLSFNIEKHFSKSDKGVQTKSISLNVNFPDTDGRYHLPIIISPYGASLWWSH